MCIRDRTYGIVFGMVVLVLYEEVLQFGDSLVQLQSITPLIGIWLPFLCFVALCLLLFYRAAYRVTEDPLGGVGTWLESLFYRRSTKQTESGS